MNLAICIVSNRDWNPYFGISLVGMVAELPKLKSQGLGSFRILPYLQASGVAKGRRLVINDAIAAGCTHALCIDDDMMFPAESMSHLMRHNKPFVAVNYQGKAGVNTAIEMSGDTPMLSKGKTGIEEADRVGFGMVLLDLSVVQQIEEPRFAFPWLPEKNTELGEDYYFCVMWRKTGNGIWVDHDVSNNVRHIAQTGLETK